MGVREFDEVGIGAKQSAEVGDEVVARLVHVGKEVFVVLVFVRGVAVRGEEVQAAIFHGSNIIQGSGVRGLIDSAKSDEGLSVLEPANVLVLGDTWDRRGSGGISRRVSERGEEKLDAVEEDGGGGKAGG